MFKLLEIEFIDHPFFKSLPIKFVGDNEEESKNYTTLIIGPNGTGKSQIFLAAISIFNSLSKLITSQNKTYTSPYEYILKYSINGKEHKVEYRNNELRIDGIYSRVNLEDLPSKVIISAFNFNDKYPLRKNRGKITDENYHYLGLKSTTNNIFIYNPQKDAIMNLYNAIITEKDILPLKEAFLTLDLKPELNLIYKPGKNFKFIQNNDYWMNKKLNPVEFGSAFTNYLKEKKRKPHNLELKKPLEIKKIEKVLSDKNKLDKLSSYLPEYIRIITELNQRKKIDVRKIVSDEKELSLQPKLDFDNRNTFNLFINQFELLQILVDLEIVAFDRFDIKKQNTNFSFDDASSGEYHIIFTFINILSVIKDNSLVMLDEPEISLHPNWQIKYMDIFNKIFKHFPNTHFLIASHSHFIVSDLKSKNSFILAIDVNKKGEIEIVQTPKNTYGWSAEQILLDVFKVATTRNFYISTTITDVLKEMSREQPNFETIKSKLESIVFLDTDDFNDHDPLLDIFKELKTFYNEINNA